MGSKIAADGEFRHEVKRCLILGRKHDKPGQHVTKQRYHFANKGQANQSYGFSSSYVWMRDLNHMVG